MLKEIDLRSPEGIGKHCRFTTYNGEHDIIGMLLVLDEHLRCTVEVNIYQTIGIECDLFLVYTL